MKDILETTHLEFDKSSFLIDLVKHDSGILYIEITQKINNDNKDAQLIKINPSVLTDLINALQKYQTKIPAKINKQNHMSDSDQQKMQDRYLKGVSLKDLALQFNKSEKIIEMILRNKGIQIVPNEIPKPKRWRRRKK